MCIKLYLWMNLLYSFRSGLVLRVGYVNHFFQHWRTYITSFRVFLIFQTLLSHEKKALAPHIHEIPVSIVTWLNVLEPQNLITQRNRWYKQIYFHLCTIHAVMKRESKMNHWNEPWSWRIDKMHLRWKHVKHTRAILQIDHNIPPHWFTYVILS